MKKITIILIIIFIALFFISTIFFYKLNDSKFNSLFISTKNSFKVLFETINNELTYGYFQWDDMYNNVKNKNTKIIEEYFNEIKELQPYVVSINLVKRNNIEKSKLYQIFSKNGILNVYFNIYDSNLNNEIKDYVVHITLNPNKILEDLKFSNYIQISKEGKDFIYGLKYVKKIKNLKFFHYISSFSIALLGILFLKQILNFYLKYHYETEGLKRIVNISEKRDFYTANHSKNVALISVYIGKKMKLNKLKLQKLKNAALLHDIGKIGISENILNKKGKLSDEEFEVIKTHPIIGADIIKTFPEIGDLAHIVLCHHEKLNGNGYPMGLKENQIPLLSQILTVADIFEALISERPYRKALEAKQVFEIMETMSINKEALKILKENHIQIIKLLK